MLDNIGTLRGNFGTCFCNFPATSSRSQANNNQEHKTTTKPPVGQMTRPAGFCFLWIRARLDSFQSPFKHCSALPEDYYGDKPTNSQPPTNKPINNPAHAPAAGRRVGWFVGGWMVVVAVVGGGAPLCKADCATPHLSVTLGGLVA